MAHAAALYTVRAKERFADHRPLGDFDERGSYLLNVLDQYLDGLQVQSADSERVLRCLRRQVEGEELIAVMQHGQSGVAADIVDQVGAPRIRQIWTDTQLVRCGSLWRLPRTQTTGWLALHVNNGRGIKGMLDEALIPRFQNAFPDLLLEIRPFVPGSALREAVAGDQLQKIRLIRYERPNDRAASSTDKWVYANEFGKLELAISMRGRGRMLRNRLVERFFGGEDAAIDDILEFEGMTFEQAKLEVKVDGRTRTYNLERPTAGHALTLDIAPELDDDGEPTEETLIEALRDALATVADEG